MKQMLQDLFVDILIDCLALWQELCMIPLTLKNVLNMSLTWTSTVLISLALTLDSSNEFVSGSCSKIHDSSPMINLPSKSCLILGCLKVFWQTWMCHFWSLFSCFSTIFTQFFLMPKSSVIIFIILSQFMLSSLVISQSVDDHHAPHAQH